MLRGMDEGRYMVQFPDMVAKCIPAVLAGTSAPCLPLWITVLIAPIAVCPLNLLCGLALGANW